MSGFPKAAANLPTRVSALGVNTAPGVKGSITTGADSVLDDGSGNCSIVGKLSSKDNTLDDGSGNMTVAGSLTVDFGVGVTLGVHLAAFASGSTLFSGTGAPSSGTGSNGDYYFRSDTPGTANQRLYVKSAGSWVGIL